ncbi:ester cyclase [Halomicrococcus gelatinilyticus]|uniref:ester cyclase n=1 Tax=Halomicrococcus gelatinilyticus TaxID=1702103 RepID=UPI002E12A531
MTTPTAVVRRYTDAGYNENNPAIIEETVADDVVVHGLHGVDAPVRGVAAYVDRAGDLLKAIPDAHAEIESLLSEDDTVAVHRTKGGTMEGDRRDVRRPGARPPPHRRRPGRREVVQRRRGRHDGTARSTRLGER